MDHSLPGQSDEAEEKGSALPEFTKRLLSLGLGAYFLTEEKIGGMLRESKIPSNIGSSITSNASKARDEVMKYITGELASVIKQVDIQEEFQKALAKHKIKVTAEIEFVPLESKEDGETTKFKVETSFNTPKVEDKEPTGDGPSTADQG